MAVLAFLGEIACLRGELGLVWAMRWQGLENGRIEGEHWRRKGGKKGGAETTRPPTTTLVLLDSCGPAWLLFQEARSRLRSIVCLEPVLFLLLALITVLAHGIVHRPTHGILIPTEALEPRGEEIEHVISRSAQTVCLAEALINTRFTVVAFCTSIAGG